MLFSTLNSLFTPLYAQSELGSEDDLTVLGLYPGTALDPDVEIKGFTVFGSTQAAYTGAVVGPGNVVVNGVLSVSSGAYFVGNSTFTAAGKIFINDGSSGQILQRTGSGSLTWISSTTIGDNLGNHIATTTLNMSGKDIIGVSTITVSSITTTAAGVTFSTNIFVMSGRIGIGTTVPGVKLRVEVDDNDIEEAIRGGSGRTTGDNYGVNGTAAGVGAAKNVGLYGWATGATDNWGLWIDTGYGIFDDRVGIGTPAPARTLDVVGDINTSTNYQIGGSTVVAILPGNSSLGIGVNTGRVNTGGNNTFLGSTAGYSNTTGSSNTFVGYSAGYWNTVGEQNTFVGYKAGTRNLSGSGNVIVGYFAEYYPQYGSANAILGNEAGYGAQNNSFSSSTLMGYRAGYSLLNGSADNIFVGFKAGYNVTTGTGNIVIGYNKDTSAIGAYNELNIGGVLYGDLSARTIGISTRVPQAALDVVSTGTAANIYAQIWRNGSGTIVSSMTSEGTLYATIAQGDNLGDHTATQNLNLAGKDIIGVSTITVSSITTTAASVTFSTNVFIAGNLSVGTTLQAAKVRVEIEDIDPEVQGIIVRSERTTGTNYALNATAAGTGALKNTGLYGWAGNATTNWGLWVDMGYGIFDDRVGIGTTNPGAMLDILDTGATDSYSLRAGTSATAYHLVVSTMGNVGVGTTAPRALLQASGTQNPAGMLDTTTNYHLILKNENNSNGAGVGIGFGLSSGDFIGASIVHTRLGGESYGDLSFNTKPSGGVVTERMRIGSDGNVLIGTTTTSTVRVSIVSSGNSGALTLRAPDITNQTILSANGPLSTTIDDGKAFGAMAIGESYARGMFHTDGKYGIGGGAGVRDIYISRHAANVLKISSDADTGAGHLVVTGNVGIGRTAPQAALDVVSTGTAANIYAQIWRNGSGTIVSSMTSLGVLYPQPAAASVPASISVSTINATATTPYGGVNITTNTVVQGRVAIGTTSTNSTDSQSSPLAVVVSANPNDSRVFTGLSTALANDRSVYFGFGKAFSTNNSAWLDYYHVADGSSGNFLGLGLYDVDHAMVVTAAGNVGIGTTDPGQLLHVASAADASKYLIFGNASQVTTSADHDNVGVLGLARGANFDWGFSVGVMGIADQANSWRAFGVYAGLGAAAPALGDYDDTALYADGNSLGHAGIFMNGKVGVGTTAPVAKLDVLDSGTGGYGEKLALRRTGAGDVGVSFQQNTVAAFGIVARSGVGQGLAFVDNYWEGDSGSERLRILSDGAVGIGISNPGAKLEIKQAVSDAYAVRVSSNNGTGMLVVQNNGNVGIGTTNPLSERASARGLGIYHDDEEAFILLKGVGNANDFSTIWFESDEATDKIWQIGHRASPLNSFQFWYYNGAAWSTPLTLLASGNVGVGTTNPGYKLDVNGDLNLAAGYVYRIGGVAQSGSSKWTAGTGDNIYRSIGNIAIGTTNPGAKFVVAGGSSTFRGLDTQKDIAAFGSASGAFKVVISTSGGVGIGTTDPGTALEVSGAVSLMQNPLVVDFNNGSGVTLAAGDLVVVNPAADVSVTRTTTEGDVSVVGAVVVGGASGATVKVAIGGIFTVKVDAATNRGDFLWTSTTAGSATPNSYPTDQGNFAIALTATAGAGTVKATFIKAENY